MAESLVRGGAKLYSYMKTKNPGISRLSEKFKLGPLNEFDKIAEFAKEVDFSIIGPEDPLAAGIIDSLTANNIPCVGPFKTCARLESSKSFTRQLMEKYNIPGNPEFKVFTSLDGVEEYVKENTNIVVKPDGLTGGKGVKVYGEHLNSIGEVTDYVKDVLSNQGKVVIEEKLEGEEFTLQTFVDGKTVVGSPLVQDHKRAYVGDQGPNTGGMGSYSCPDHLLPFIEGKYVNEALKIMEKTVNAVKRETGVEYKGILYGQFMLTRNGLRLVEYNVRFGDPEVMNILPILENNFVDICSKIIDGNLSSKDTVYLKKATVVKYLAPIGYPVNPQPTEVQVDEEKIKEVGGKIYYASVNEVDGVIKTTTSRSIAVLGIGDTQEEAEKIAETSIGFISGNLFHRRDIGTKKLIEKRIQHMKELLG
ncbi:MAG: phosphoribosylamine--glycine ligase [Candidatus Odinarchaeia archaeon]